MRYKKSKFGRETEKTSTTPKEERAFSCAQKREHAAFHPTVFLASKRELFAFKVVLTLERDDDDDDDDEFVFSH